MSRPKFLNCPMTPGVIRAIRERQTAYDRDPEEYERAERQREEDYQREQQEQAEMHQRAVEGE